MEQFVIAIPSYGRAHKIGTQQTTFQWIPRDMHPRVIYFVEPEELAEYRTALDNNGAQLIALRSTESVVPRHSWGAIMDHIIDTLCPEYERVIIMDDDLKLAYRPDLQNKPSHMEPMTNEVFNNTIDDLCYVTHGEYPFTSIQYRQFCQTKREPKEYNQRMSMIWSLNGPFFAEHSYRFYRHSRLAFMGDYYFFMSLLQDGIPNMVLNRYTKEDVPNAAGGEQSKRNPSDFNKAVAQLVKMFPGYATPYVKQNKGAWEDGYWGIRIKAKQLYDDSKRKFNGV